MKKTTLNKEVDRVWSHVQEALDFNQHHHGRKLYELNAQEERDYRRNDDRPWWGLNIPETARLLSLQWLIRYSPKLKPQDRGEAVALPTIGDILTCKPSCMYAGALMAEYGARVEKALLDCKAPIEAIMGSNYTQLIKA